MVKEQSVGDHREFLGVRNGGFFHKPCAFPGAGGKRVATEALQKRAWGVQRARTSGWDVACGGEETFVARD